MTQAVLRETIHLKADPDSVWSYQTEPEHLDMMRTALQDMVVA